MLKANMQNAWLGKKNFKIQCYSQEIFYYLLFLSNLKYSLFHPGLIKLYQGTKLLLKKNSNVLSKKQIDLFTQSNRFSRNKLEKWNVITPQRWQKNFLSENYVTQNTKVEFLNSKISLIFNKFVTLFFSFNTNYSGKIYSQFFLLKQFGVNSLGYTSPAISFTKFFSKWTDGHAFLSSIYFYSTYPLIFGNPVFQKEILALNWHTSLLDFYAWKHAFPFFIFKMNNFNIKIDFFLLKLDKLKINFVLFSDCLYHSKFLSYLTRSLFFTVGLVPFGTAPWLLNFALPIASESNLLQLLFLKFVLTIQRQTVYARYNFNKNLWAQTLLTSRFI